MCHGGDFRKAVEMWDEVAFPTFYVSKLEYGIGSAELGVRLEGSSIRGTWGCSVAWIFVLAACYSHSRILSNHDHDA